MNTQDCLILCGFIAYSIYKKNKKYFGELNSKKELEKLNLKQSKQK